MGEPAPQRSLAKIFSSSSAEAVGEQEGGFVFNFFDAGVIIDELARGEPAPSAGKKKKKKRSKKKTAHHGQGQGESKVYNADSSSSEDEARLPQSPPPPPQPLQPPQPQQQLSHKSVVSTPLPSAKDTATPAPASSSSTTTTRNSSSSSLDRGKQAPQESLTKAKKAKAKSKGKQAAPDDDDESWFDPQPQASPLRSHTGESPSGAGHKGLKEKAPFFRTAKLDPTLDAASAQRLRFGDGKNVVAIGHPKIKNANWIEEGGSARLHSSPFSFGFNM